MLHYLLLQTLLMLQLLLLRRQPAAECTRCCQLAHILLRHQFTLQQVHALHGLSSVLPGGVACCCRSSCCIVAAGGLEALVAGRRLRHHAGWSWAAQVWLGHGGPVLVHDCSRALLGVRALQRCRRPWPLAVAVRLKCWSRHAAEIEVCPRLQR